MVNWSGKGEMVTMVFIIRIEMASKSRDDKLGNADTGEARIRIDVTV